MVRGRCLSKITRLWVNKEKEYQLNKKIWHCPHLSFFCYTQNYYIHKHVTYCYTLLYTNGCTHALIVIQVCILHRIILI